MPKPERNDACPGGTEAGQERDTPRQSGTVGTERDGWDRAGQEPKLTRAIIELYVNATTGEFTATEARQELDVASKEGKETLRKTLNRMVVEGILVRPSKKEGLYRRTGKVYDDIDWNASDLEFSVEWPFPDITTHIEMYPGNIAVIAGLSNAGKTAFCLQFTKSNMAWGKRLHFYNTETEDQQFRRRCNRVGIESLWFTARRPKIKMAELVDLPDWDGDALNVIDYLHVPDEAYKLSGELAKIRSRLKGGLALVAIQKPPDRKFGYGGYQTTNPVQLYLALDFNKLEVIKAKTPRDGVENPNGMSWTFTLKYGAEFENISRFYGFDNQ